MSDDLHDEIDALARDIERAIAEATLCLDRYDFDPVYRGAEWSQERFL